MYFFLLQILSAFVDIPTIHVLRLHGIYQDGKRTDYSSLIGEEIGKRLNIKCLSIKFVKTHAENYSCEGTFPELWFDNLLIKIVSNIPSILSLILIRLPMVQCKTTYLHDLVVKIVEVAKALKRFFIRDTVVSIDDASRIVLSVQNLRHKGNSEDKYEDGTTDESPPIYLRPRKPEVERKTIEKQAHTEIFEMVFIDVYGNCTKLTDPSFLPNHNKLTADGGNLMAATLPEDEDRFIHRLGQLTQQVYDCSLDRFCYSGYQECRLERKQEIVDDESLGKHNSRSKYISVTENPLQVIIFPTRDLRLHLDLLDLNDKVSTPNF